MNTSLIQRCAMSYIIQKFRRTEHSVLLWRADLTRWGLYGDDDSYLGYGGIHPGAVQRVTPAEELVWRHVGWEKSSRCPLTKLFECSSMVVFYESKQMFTNYFWWSACTHSLEKQASSKLSSSKTSEGTQSFGKLEFPGPKYLNKCFYSPVKQAD